MGVICQILIKPPREGKHIVGQPIVGVVKYILNKPTQYKKISLELIGQGKTEWIRENRKNPKGGPTSNYIKYEGNEKFTVEKIIIDEKRPNLILSEGIHEHPFEILLPINIPPSVKTDICEIYYYIQMKFEKLSPLKVPKKFKTQTLRVHANVPSSTPDQPISFGVDKTLAKLFSKNKKKHSVKLKAQLENGYLMPGRDTKLSFVVTNDTDVKVGVKTELICDVIYKDNFNKVKKESHVLKNLRTPDVPENSIANLNNIIPVYIDMYTVRNSKVMSREYKLKMTVKLPLPHVNATVEMPVVIGERYCAADLRLIDEPPSYWEAMREVSTKV